MKQKNITFRMKNTNKKLNNQAKIVKASFQQVDIASSLSITKLAKNRKASLVMRSFIAIFPGSNITKYSGLNTVAKYIHPVKLVSDLAKLFNGVNRQNIVQSISKTFPSVRHNATKFGVNPVKSALQNRLFNRVNQILMAIALSSMSGISRICKIAAFSSDGLVKTLLKLGKAINENAISAALKNLGQVGARKLQSVLLSKNSQWLRESGLGRITFEPIQWLNLYVAIKKGQPKDTTRQKRVQTAITRCWFLSAN